MHFLTCVGFLVELMAHLGADNEFLTGRGLFRVELSRVHLLRSNLNFKAHVEGFIELIPITAGFEFLAHFVIEIEELITSAADSRSELDALAREYIEARSFNTDAAVRP